MSDESFQKLWKAAVRYRPASLVTETLLRAVYEAASDVRVGDEAVEAALEQLLSSFGPSGRMAYEGGSRNAENQKPPRLIISRLPGARRQQR